MPQLDNPRHETFARARAKGALLDDAYEDAGFAHNRSHAARLAGRPEVAARIAELRAEQAALSDCAAAQVIADLVRMARDSEVLKTPAGVKEARENLLAAHKLAATIAAQRRYERGNIISFNEDAEHLRPAGVP